MELLEALLFKSFKYFHSQCVLKGLYETYSIKKIKNMSKHCCKNLLPFSSKEAVTAAQVDELESITTETKLDGAERKAACDKWQSLFFGLPRFLKQ